jgi:hypothetical protein
MYRLLVAAALMVPTIAHGQTRYEMPIECDSVSVGGQAFSCANTKHLYYKSYRGLASFGGPAPTDTTVLLIADNGKAVAFTGNAIQKKDGHNILYVNRLQLATRTQRLPTIEVDGICDIELEQGVLKQGSCAARDINGGEATIQVHGSGVVKQVDFNGPSVQ